jgi:O-antigen biosynthesis protein WbqP
MTFIEKVFALLLIVILLPLTILIAIAVKLTSKGPVIHWSKRVGVGNKIFLMPKIRTMITNAPQLATHLMQKEQSYLSPIGKYLRKTSLDEIPQLWSILVGDMSFIGPRPALFNQSDLISLRTRYNIHHLKPGVTGWAQVNGRDSISIAEKVELEVEYNQRKSNFIFNLRILFLTFFKVLFKKDIKH